MYNMMLYIIEIYMLLFIYMLYILFPHIPIVRYIKTIESHPQTTPDRPVLGR